MSRLKDCKNDILSFVPLASQRESKHIENIFKHLKGRYPIKMINKAITQLEQHELAKEIGQKGERGILSAKVGELEGLEINGSGWCRKVKVRVWDFNQDDMDWIRGEGRYSQG